MNVRTTVLCGTLNSNFCPFQELTVLHLWELKRFDADSLAELKYLRRLFIQSWPSIERYKFRLGAVVSGLSSLKLLSARILEDHLSDQARDLIRTKNNKNII